MIAIGSDHAAAELRRVIREYLEKRGVEYIDCGTDEAPSDYPVIAKEVCSRIQSGEADTGILLCGTGIGMSMAANKMRGIRAAVCTETYSAKYTRLHNDANVLAMGGGFTGELLANEIVDVFLYTEFSGLEKHSRRISKIENY